MRYRKKPVEVEAIQASGTERSNREIINWTKDSDTPAVMVHRCRQLSDGSTLLDTEPSLTISTLEGAHWVSPGDWVIRGVAGEHYPCKPDIFEATYEAVEPPKEQ